MREHVFSDIMSRIRLIAVRTLSNSNRHNFAVDATMIFQLLGIFEGFVALATFEVLRVGMDFHVGVLETGQNWRFEIAIGICAAVEFKIN